MDKTSSLPFDILVKILVLIKFYTIWIIILIAIPSILFLTSFFLPVKELQIDSGICVQCGATYSKSLVKWWTIPVKKSKTIFYREEIENLYDFVIAQKHDHEWCPAYTENKKGSLLFWKSEYKNMGENEVYPIYQPRLTHIALTMAEYLRYSGQDFRRELCREIITSRMVDSYNNVCLTYDSSNARDVKTARKIWEEWLEKRKNSVIEPVDKEKIPGWANSSDLHIPSNVAIEDNQKKQSSDYCRFWFF